MPNSTQVCDKQNRFIYTINLYSQYTITKAIKSIWSSLWDKQADILSLKLEA